MPVNKAICYELFRAASLSGSVISIDTGTYLARSLRLIGFSSRLELQNFHSSIHSSSEELNNETQNSDLRIPIEPGPEDCCQVSCRSWVIENIDCNICGSVRTPSNEAVGTNSSIINLVHLLGLQNSCVECVWVVYWRELKAYQTEMAKRHGKPPPPMDPFEKLEKELALRNDPPNGQP